MRIALKNIAKVRIGYQLRGGLEHDPAGTHLIAQMKDFGPKARLEGRRLSSFIPTRDVSPYAVGAGDLLFLARGNRNRAYTTEGLGEKVVASNHFFILTPDPARLRPGYLAWYLNSSPVQSLLRSNAQGTTMMLVPRTVFENVEIEVPPLLVQDRVIELAALREKQRRLVVQLEKKREALLEAACLNAIEKATNEEPMNV